MKIQEFNESKAPLVKIDKQLDRFKGKVLFIDKLALADRLRLQTYWNFGKYSHFSLER